jgi:hypothetical protein
MRMTTDVAAVKMAAPLNTCTTIEQRGFVRFLWAKNMDAAKDIHKEMLPIWAAFLCAAHMGSISLWSKASSKASCPHSAIQSFLFQMRVSSPFLKVTQYIPTSSSLSSCHFYPPLYLSFSKPL